MGRPPSNGAPSFRFNSTEVTHMEAILQKYEGQVPPRDFLVDLAERFSNMPERAGKSTVQMKQVWSWFQNRRYALRSKLVKSPGKPSTSSVARDEVTPVRNVLPVPQQTPVISGPNMVNDTSETPQMEFEAKSAKDGAWYDVQAFHSHRYLETGNPEVLVRFAGCEQAEDEWINIRKHVRQRSLPCETSECVAVLPGDLILCFQEGKEQALYFDAHVLNAQRRRHDMRGCRCRFLVRYDHDQSEEIVPLRKLCRRPETDYRLQVLHAANELPSVSVSEVPQKPVVDLTSSSSSRMTISNPTANSIAISPPLKTVGPSGTPPVPNQTRGPISSTSLPAPRQTLVPALTPTQMTPVSLPAPTPTPISIQTASISAPVSALISAATSTPAAGSVSPATVTGSPALPPGSVPEKLKSDIPDIPDPASVPGIPTPVSEQQKVESDISAPIPVSETIKVEDVSNPGLSAVEGAALENVTRPVGASLVLGTIKTESNNLETGLLPGASDTGK